MNVLDLFSGIGGFSLGLERAGMRTVAFCEIEPYCRAVLRKHWPEVPCYDDVRTLTADRLRADGIIPDVICGGFPCQDISTAGKGAGIEGDRSGLWREYARIIGEVRPRYVIVENVSALLGRGLGRVLGDLASLGFDAEWHCIPASAVGAPHRRDRIWIMAYPGRDVHARGLVRGRSDREAPIGEGSDERQGNTQDRKRLRLEPGASGADVADAAGERRGEARQHSERHSQRPASSGYVGHSYGQRHEGAGRELPRGWGELAAASLGINGQWAAEPELGRVADGVPDWAHRLRALGNAVVPQIPQIIGEAIMRFERELTA